MRFSEAELLTQTEGFIWVLTRVSALFVALPLFAGHTVPQRVRLLLAVGITFAVLPTLPPPPDVPLFSLAGLLIGTQQFLIGAAMGFVLHMVFGAIVFGGQNVAYSMGLGFASLIDPMTGVQVPTIAQFYQLLATLLLFTMDGHLVMIQLLADSFQALPVGLTGLHKGSLREIADWVSRLLAAGVLMSLPLVVALLVVNLGFGIGSRAAPQLNIFSVGFPITLLLGLVLMGISLPEVLTLFSNFLDDGFRLAQGIAR